MTDTFKVFNKTKHLEEAEKIKKIIYYCSKCNYEIEYSTYDNLKQIIEDAKSIRCFGNEPSVRRAIKLLNNDNKVKNQIDVIMSEKCKARLDRLEQIKKDNSVQFKVIKGPITVVFE